MARRKKPSSDQRARLIAANASRCCVCKRNGIGLHLHHIDGDASSTVDKNLAVLCVEDHDRHHRSSSYEPSVQHLELGAQEILHHKVSWEKFVTVCQTPGSPVLATVTMFGTGELIHSAQVVYQWKDETIEHKRSFHLLDGGYDQWAEELLKEIASVGPHLGIATVREPQPVEHCPCCGIGYSHTMKPALVAKHTDSRWKTHSLMSIYVNPRNPSLAISLGLAQEHLYSSSLHLCQGEFLHFACDYYDERIKVRQKPSVRTQVTRLVEKVVKEWAPAQLLIGTGSREAPELIDTLDLPRCWE